MKNTRLIAIVLFICIFMGLVFVGCASKKPSEGKDETTNAQSSNVTSVKGSQVENKDKQTVTDENGNIVVVDDNDDTEKVTNNNNQGNKTSVTNSYNQSKTNVTKNNTTKTTTTKGGNNSYTSGTFGTAGPGNTGSTDENGDLWSPIY